MGCPIIRPTETVSLLFGFGRMLQVLLPREKTRILQNTGVLQLTVDVCVCVSTERIQNVLESLGSFV